MLQAVSLATFLTYKIDFNKNTKTVTFLCGLHSVCSHIMTRSDLFMYFSTRVERLSRELVSLYRMAHQSVSAILIAHETRLRS